MRHVRDKWVQEKRIEILQYRWEDIIESHDRPRHRGNPRIVRLYRLIIDAVGFAIFAVGAYAVMK